ncbi:MAG TPA: DeoR/GlpR family DNA-binding transcription regulator [Bacteroidales bacterium]|nr:DeoR/GlpR family DNA-binding transcription regulator [Bacteroidales bacterium]
MAISIAERHKIILQKLKDAGYVNVAGISKELGVSTVTIRKDLAFLEEKKLLFRVHGSATLTDQYAPDRHVNEKVKLFVDEKRRIGEYAASLLSDGDSIILASGSTVNEFSRHLTGKKGLVAVCASLNASRELALAGAAEVIQLGGIMRQTSQSVVGPYAEKMLEGFRCSKLFIGVDGIDASYGLTTTNALEATLNQRMIASALRVIVLADHSKFGRHGFSRICGIEKVDVVITDTLVSVSQVKEFEEKGVRVVRV